MRKWHFKKRGKIWIIHKLCWYAAAASAKSFQLCPTLCDPIDGSPLGSPCPWDSPGKNTGVGCHFLLQCMKVKSESEVAQSCLTLSDPMDCSLPGSCVHGIFQARVLEWGAIAFSICWYTYELLWGELEPYVIPFITINFRDIRYLNKKINWEKFQMTFFFFC